MGESGPGMERQNRSGAAAMKPFAANQVTIEFAAVA
jgi:hypothetical protein